VRLGQVIVLEEYAQFNLTSRLLANLHLVGLGPAPAASLTYNRFSSLQGAERRGNLLYDSPPYLLCDRTLQPSLQITH